MNEKPIIFSGPMVRAILDGRKTQTRRVVKVRGLRKIGPGDAPDDDPFEFGVDDEYGDWWTLSRDDERPIPCPYGQPGDLLWVRETWTESPFLDTRGEIIHRADWNEGRIHPMRWKPSIHMPKQACRLWLKVTGVWVERLQEISEGDASREGIAVNHFPRHRVEQFEDLWDSINAKRGYGWDVNPWVWVVEFEKSDASSPA